MKRQRIASVAILCAVISTGVVLRVGAQNPSALKGANGIAYSEFSGYEAWPVIATSQPDDAGGCGTSKDGCMKAILGNPVMINAYKAGIPANGKSVPDGAKIAKIEWSKTRNNASPYGITVPGVQREVSFMIKDSKRFADTNGWGYVTFVRDEAAGTLKPATNDPATGRTLCHPCHTKGATKARDFVYTSYAQR